MKRSPSTSMTKKHLCGGRTDTVLYAASISRVAACVPGGAEATCNVKMRKILQSQKDWFGVIEHEDAHAYKQNEARLKEDHKPLRHDKAPRKALQHAQRAQITPLF